MNSALFLLSTGRKYVGVRSDWGGQDQHRNADFSAAGEKPYDGGCHRQGRFEGVLAVTLACRLKRIL